MADWWALSEIACRAPDSGRRLAWHDGKWVAHAQWLDLVAGWEATMADDAVSHWVVYLNDPLVFSAAVLACWHEGKTVVLPGDDRPATLDALRLPGHAFAGDLPGARQAVATRARGRPRKAIDLNMARVQMYTSGSQGQPSAIDKRLFQLVSEVDALEGAFGAALASAPGDEPSVWSTVSHQHIYGLLFLVLWPLSAGRPMVTRRLLYPEDMAACLGLRPSVLVASPAHLKRLGEHLDWGPVRDGLRVVFSSGGPLPFEASRSAALCLGQVPTEVFGSSETGGIAWRRCLHADQPWQTFADVAWRVVDGCLSVSSPRLPDASWWTTSDRVELVGSDSFRLLGRADRIVKIEEKRVSLTAVEQLLLATPWVQEVRALVVQTVVGERVAVVAVPTALGREVLDKGRRALGDVLRQTLASGLEPVALPKRWRFVDALPVNAQGKCTEALLKDLFGPSAVPDTAAAPDAPVASHSSAHLPPVQWRERGATEALACLDIHAGLTVFDGHFPRAAILPGVALLHWSLTLGRACFPLSGHFERIEALKFMMPVRPGTALMLRLQYTPRLANPELCSLAFRLYSIDVDSTGQRDHASGRAVWSRAAPADA